MKEKIKNWAEDYGYQVKWISIEYAFFEIRDPYIVMNHLRTLEEKINRKVYSIDKLHTEEGLQIWLEEE